MAITESPSPGGHRQRGRRRGDGPDRPRRRLRLPHHPADRGRPALRADGRRRQGRHRVRDRRERAQRHERRDRLRRRRRADDDRDLLPGLRPHVGGPLRRRELPAPGGHDHREPRPLRPHQHPLRPQRHHGWPRHRLGPALRREPPGGLRQLHPGHPHRRAHGRAPAGHAHVRRLRHQRRHRPAADAHQGPGPEVHRALPPHQPHARRQEPRHRRSVRRPARLVLRAQGRPEPGDGPLAQGHPGRRRRVRRAERPQVRPARDRTSWRTPRSPSSSSAPPPAPRG